MNPETTFRLIQLNNEFYQSFGAAFAATRRRLQPGIQRILNFIPSDGHWLDLGCGSGTLAREWAAGRRTGSYTGLDFSPALLYEAGIAVKDLEHPALQIHFKQADLGSETWASDFKNSFYDGLLSFAVLHHIPGNDLRLRILNQVRTLLKPAGIFIHSEWQFQNSPRLMQRVLSWQDIGLDPNQLEAGDTLLDWRYVLPGQQERVGRRYVHLFQSDELNSLAADSGFKILEEFHSDGSGGHLGLYQIWQVV